MNQPTKSPKNKIKSFYKKRSKTWIVLTVLLFIIIGIFIYNKVSFNIARNNAKEEVTKLIDEIEAESESEVVFKEVRDEGCKKSQRGWFGSSTACNYVGEMYLTDQKLKSALEHVLNVSNHNGFHHDKFSPDLESSLQESVRGFDLYKDNGSMKFNISFYNPSLRSDPSIEDYKIFNDDFPLSNTTVDFNKDSIIHISIYITYKSSTGL